MKDLEEGVEFKKAKANNDLETNLFSRQSGFHIERSKNLKKNF